MKDSPEARAEELLALARRAGAEAADVMVAREASVSVTVRQGALEHAERSEVTEFGLRVFVGRRQAVVSTTDDRPESLAELAGRAVAVARAAPEDPWAGLADPDELARDTDAGPLEIADTAPPPDASALEAAALAADAAARAVPGVTQVDPASAGHAVRETWLAATNGFSAGFRRTLHSTSAVAIAGEGLGMERDWDGDSRVFGADLRDPAEIGRTAGERAVARLGARKPPTGRFPVIFDERVAATLIGHLVAAASGTAIARGASWLLDAEGEQVLPDGIDLLEDPLKRRGMLSRPFDGEGLACRPRRLVEDGRLTGWILDLATARKLGRRSTANAARSPGSTPSPSAWNLELTQGEASRAALMREMGEGLLVTSLIGSTINPTTGDYSRGASGFWVERGEIAYPVNEATVAGNLRDFLRRVVPANDARPWTSRVVPSLLIDGLTIAGR